MMDCQIRVLHGRRTGAVKLLSAMEGLMQISESSVNLSSHRTAVEEYHQQESLRYWKTGDDSLGQNASTREGKNNQPGGLSNDASVKVSLSSESVRKSSTVESSEMIAEREVMGDLNIRILRAIIERMTGKKIKLFSFNPNEVKGIADNNKAEVPDKSEPSASAGFGLEYDYHESYYESESTSFQGSGKIVTADGKEIDFSLELNMSREFYQENNLSVRMGEALKDPLVVNFNGNSAQLTHNKFSFDIDADGEVDQISFVTPESGFLAIDKDNNNMITDGSELFGAMTGNGFNELAGYDEDANGWIDENDSVFDRLRVWVKDSSGADQLLALGQKGIGALYLGNVSTSFEVKSEDNVKQGQIQSSGIYLTEDYQIGTVQQLDLVV